MDHASGGHGPFRRILFCTDFSENADHAFGFALEQALRSPDAVLFILHVIPEPDAQFWKTYIYEVEGVDNKAKQDIDAKVDAAYRSRVPPGMRLEVEMRIGKESTHILEFARARGADLIILGRQGKSALKKVWFGNVTEAVARKAECPVLVVPLRDRDRAARTS